MLVTGASGGVGRFAIQLAKLAGAHVTGLARRTEGLAELGADEVITEIDLRGRTYELIVDAVGADVLGAAIQRVAPGGTVVSFASTVPEPVATRPASCSPGRREPSSTACTSSLSSSTPNRRSDLRRLADLVAAGKLDPQIDVTLSWSDAGEAIEALLDRRVNGKAVLRID